MLVLGVFLATMVLFSEPNFFGIRPHAVKRGLDIHSAGDFLALAEEILGDREAVVARELTKVHEEFIRGPLSQLRTDIGKRTLKGETTVLIQGRHRRKPGQYGI